MKQRYENISHDLAWRAADACFDRKWNRRDVLAFAEKNSGVSRRELYAEQLTNSVNKRLEATDAVAYYVEEMIETILSGEEVEDMEEVTVRERPDGMTGKIRSIANLCLSHQLLGHVAALALMPLFRARILPTQHASIPRRGQTRLKWQVQRFLLQKRLGIRCYVKTDVRGAYGNTMYADIIAAIEREIPSATWIIKLLRYLERYAPDGHLIIGGYLDAWLFNFAMSYALRATLAAGRWRRGVHHRYVECIVSYMDDFVLLARSKTGLRAALRFLGEWLWNRYRLAIKQTSCIQRLCSVTEERDRRHRARPSQRGCPSIDMGGYLIHRTYITMRPRVCKRVIRDYVRARRDAARTGTVRTKRANSVRSRYGSIKQTDAAYFRRKYEVNRIMLTVRAVSSNASALQSRRRKEWLVQYVLRRNEGICCA